MKYRYRMSMYVGQMLFAFLIVGLMTWGYGKINPDNSRFIRDCCFVIGLSIFSFAVFVREYSNRYVALCDDCIRFNSFRFKDVTRKKPVSFNVKYDDVYGIGVKTLPIIGIWAIVIEAKYLPHGMTVSFCFKKHKELCRNLCKLVKEHNPDAYVDSRLAKYCEE